MGDGGRVEVWGVKDKKSITSQIIVSCHFVATLTRDSRLFGDSFRMREPPSKKSFA